MYIYHNFNTFSVTIFGLFPYLRYIFITTFYHLMNVNMHIFLVLIFVRVYFWSRCVFLRGIFKKFLEVYFKRFFLSHTDTLLLFFVVSSNCFTYMNKRIFPPTVNESPFIFTPIHQY